MSVIPITLFFSLLLAGLFIALFAREQRRRFASAERDSLLPLADEAAVACEGRPEQGANRRGAAVPTEPAHDHDHDDDHDHDHDHEGGNCGCRSGLRPPCVGCLKRTGVPSLSPRQS